MGAGSLGATALFTVGGCSYFGRNDPPPPTVTQLPGVLDPISGLIATTRLHVLRLDAAIAADATDAPRLTPLRDNRQEQLTALEAEFARVNPPASGASGSATSVPVAPATGTVAMPGSPEAIISAIRGDAATAQVQFTDAVSAASRYRAAMFGSIAAALASHRAVLA